MSNQIQRHLDNFRNDHDIILDHIKTLRSLCKSGIEKNSLSIARTINELGDFVIQHLAVENRMLYPFLEKSDVPELSSLGSRYQEQMKGLSAPFITFVRKWSVAKAVMDDPEGFRSDANFVLRKVHERIGQENNHFYPTVEKYI